MSSVGRREYILDCPEISECEAGKGYGRWVELSCLAGDRIVSQCVTSIPNTTISHVSRMLTLLGGMELTISEAHELASVAPSSEVPC